MGDTVIALLWGGCVPGPGDPVPLPVADSGEFYAEVEPVLVARCANPGCHGGAERPLEVFAPLKHRLDPALDHRDLPLTVDEHRANFDRARAFLVDVEVPLDSALLYKPLAPEAGGGAHAGGVSFEDRTDPGFRALRAWVAR